MLTLKHLTVSVNNKDILRDISYSFEKGKLYAVMGPNGSGKSTLAQSIMGHPSYTLSKKTRILFNNKNITDLTADKRAKRGLFLTFQTPLSLAGVTIYQLFRFMMDKKMDLLATRKKAQTYARALRISEELLSRSLNDNFSGGEKKKMEVLQAAMSGADCIFFDEIDTGVDVDALKTIAAFLKTMMNKKKTFIIITHYNRILKYIKPNVVLIIKDGALVKTGAAALAQRIEKEGYADTSA